MIRTHAWLVNVAAMAIATVLAGAEPAPETAAPDQETLNKQLAQKLSNATMEGWYSVDGREQAPKQDKYTLGRVFHVKDDTWHFDARIQFSGRDMTVPLELP